MDGRLVGQRALPRRCVPNVSSCSNGGVDGDGGIGETRLRLSDYATQTAFGGYFKNLAFFRRALGLSEALALSSLPPPPATALGLGGEAAKRTAAKAAAEAAAAKARVAAAKAAAAAKAEAEAGPTVYARLVRQSRPTGFWPMDEQTGGVFEDRSNNAGSAAASHTASSSYVPAAGIVDAGIGRVRYGVGGATEALLGAGAGPLRCEAVHRAGLVLGEAGPLTPPDRPGFRAALFQGGGARGADGALCDCVDEPAAAADGFSGADNGGRQRRRRRAVPTPLLDFTFELWMRRTDPAAARGSSGPGLGGGGARLPAQQETLVSLGSESRPLPGAAWWRLGAADGRLDFAIEGEARPVGPCPAASCGGREIRDLEWHHVAVTRTSRPDEVSVSRATLPQPAAQSASSPC